MSFLPTFSRFDVAQRCVFPWTSHLRWPKRPDSDFAGFGRAVSEASECLAVWGHAPYDAVIERNGLGDSDRRKFLSAIAHVAELLADEACTDRWRKAEVALAYDVVTATAREVRKAHPRDYSDQRPRELAGTPDLVRLRADGVLVVRDYKTGRYKWGHRPGDTPQLRALGLSAARAYGHRLVVVETVQVDDDGLRPLEDELDDFELAVVAGELRQVYERIQGPPEPPKPGHWCRGGYCPLVASCPATERTLAAISSASELKHPLTAEIASAAHAAYALERLAAAEMAIDTIRHAVEEYARAHGPVPLANGKMWGAVQSDGRESVDLSVAGAVELVERHLGAFGAASAIDRKTSKSALEAAAKAAQQKRGEGVQKARALFDALRELGALKKGAPYETFTEFTPRPDTDTTTTTTTENNHV